MPRQRTHTRRMVFHHSASGDVSAAIIDKWHRARGMAGCGYHYVIRANGALEYGRDISTIGAHTRGRNGDSIGVCLTGDFGKSLPAPEQIDRACALYAEMSEIYGVMLDVEYHRPSDDPDPCPGRLLPRYYFEQRLHAAIRN